MNLNEFIRDLSWFIFISLIFSMFSSLWLRFFCAQGTPGATRGDQSSAVTPRCTTWALLTTPLATRNGQDPAAAWTRTCLTWNIWNLWNIWRKHIKTYQNILNIFTLLNKLNQNDSNWSRSFELLTYPVPAFAFSPLAACSTRGCSRTSSLATWLKE